jgi:hypothetical protein
VFLQAHFEFRSQARKNVIEAWFQRSSRQHKRKIFHTQDINNWLFSVTVTTRRELSEHIMKQISIHLQFYFLPPNTRQLYIQRKK